MNKLHLTCYESCYDWNRLIGSIMIKLFGTIYVLTWVINLNIYLYYCLYSSSLLNIISLEIVITIVSESLPLGKVVCLGWMCYSPLPLSHTSSPLAVLIQPSPQSQSCQEVPSNLSWSWAVMSAHPAPAGLCQWGRESSAAATVLTTTMSTGAQQLRDSESAAACASCTEETNRETSVSCGPMLSWIVLKFDLIWWGLMSFHTMQKRSRKKT